MGVKRKTLLTHILTHIRAIPYGMCIHPSISLSLSISTTICNHIEVYVICLRYDPVPRWMIGLEGLFSHLCVVFLLFYSTSKFFLCSICMRLPLGGVGGGWPLIGYRLLSGCPYRLKARVHQTNLNVNHFVFSISIFVCWGTSKQRNKVGKKEKKI